MTIEVPKGASYLNFANRLLDKLLKEFADYEFINRTESPIDEFTYIEHDGYYYRKVTRDDSIVVVDESRYVDFYKLNDMMASGISFQECIEYMVFMELTEILVVSKFDGQIENLSPIVTIDINSDGWDEIFFSGEETLLNKMAEVLKKDYEIKGIEQRKHRFHDFIRKAFRTNKKR